MFMKMKNNLIMVIKDYMNMMREQIYINVSLQIRQKPQF